MDKENHRSGFRNLEGDFSLSLDRITAAVSPCDPTKVCLLTERCELLHAPSAADICEITISITITPANSELTLQEAIDSALEWVLSRSVGFLIQNLPFDQATCSEDGLPMCTQRLVNSQVWSEVLSSACSTPDELGDRKERTSPQRISRPEVVQ